MPFALDVMRSFEGSRSGRDVQIRRESSASHIYTNWQRDMYPGALRGIDDRPLRRKLRLSPDTLAV